MQFCVACWGKGSVAPCDEHRSPTHADAQLGCTVTVKKAPLRAHFSNSHAFFVERGSTRVLLSQRDILAEAAENDVHWVGLNVLFHLAEHQSGGNVTYEDLLLVFTAGMHSSRLSIESKSWFDSVDLSFDHARAFLALLSVSGAKAMEYLLKTLLAG